MATETINIISDESTSQIIIEHLEQERDPDAPVSLAYLVFVAIMNLLHNGTISTEVDRILAEARAADRPEEGSA